MAEDRLEPQIAPGEGYSPLSALISTALRTWGNSHPGAVDADTIHLFLSFANRVINDVNLHPYRTDATPLDFLADVRERSPIPDILMIDGLLHYYAGQQGSQKIQVFTPAYYRSLNSILWNDLNGNTKIEIRAVDRSAGRSTINGLPEDE